jgi:hypothetical protein
MKPNVSHNIREHVRLVQSAHRKVHFKMWRLPSSGCTEGGGG